MSYIYTVYIYIHSIYIYIHTDILFLSSQDVFPLVPFHIFLSPDPERNQSLVVTKSCSMPLTGQHSRPLWDHRLTYRFLVLTIPMFFFVPDFDPYTSYSHETAIKMRYAPIFGLESYWLPYFVIIANWSTPPVGVLPVSWFVNKNPLIFLVQKLIIIRHRNTTLYYI